MYTRVRGTIVGGSLIGIVVLTCACSGSDSANPEAASSASLVSPTGTPVATTVPSAPPTPDELYLAELDRAGILAIPGLNQQKAVRVGYGICSLFDNGETYSSIGLGAVNDNPQINMDQANAIITSAVTTLCPEHTEQVPS